MTALRLTVLLGPREVVEAAELRMGVLPHTLAMAVPFDGWNEAAGGNVLPTAMSKVAEMFAAGIKRGEHLAEPEGEAAEPPLVTPASPAPVVPAPAEPDTTEWPDPLVRDHLFDDVLRELLGGDEFQRCIEGIIRARRIVALVERRAA